jgi:hypothetical protein
MREFWEDDPDLFWAYRFSYYNKMRAQNKINNYNAWLYGAYVYDALCVALGNSFGKGHHAYPDRPYGETVEENKELELQKNVLSIKERVAQVQALWKGKGTTPQEKREKVVTKENG